MIEKYLDLEGQRIISIEIIYLKILDDITFNSKIELIKVNPAYTSKIAEQKFCGRMKLNTHDGAAYTIARRGMGIKDKFIAS